MKHKRLKNQSITTLQKYRPALILFLEIYLEGREKLTESATVRSSAQQSLHVNPIQTSHPKMTHCYATVDEIKTIL